MSNKIMCLPRIFAVFSALILSGFLGTASAAPLVIDSFSACSQSLSVPTAGATVSSTAAGCGASVLGGTRQIDLAYTNGGGLPITADVFLFGTLPGLFYAEDSSIDGVVTLTYSGVGFDLTSGGVGNHDKFVFDFRNSDINLVYGVTVVGGGTSTYNSGVIAPILTPTILNANFSSFSLGADFTAVTSLVFSFDSSGVIGNDFVINSITTDGHTPVAAPEPGSLMLLGIGAIGLVGFRFLRRKEDAIIGFSV
ncbi:MAG: PEP-CTERM sorting domain-containing protein [Nitrospirota bacterium]